MSNTELKQGRWVANCWLGNDGPSMKELGVTKVSDPRKTVARVMEPKRADWCGRVLGAAHELLIRVGLGGIEVTLRIWGMREFNG